MIVLTTPFGNIGRQRLRKRVAARLQRIRLFARDRSRLPAALCDRVEVVGAE